MSKRAAIAVAVERFFEAGPPLPWAISDAQAFLHALVHSAGYAPDHTHLWSHHHVTQAALWSHLRRASTLWQDVETLLILWITRTWISSYRTYLACADTLRDDPEATALPFEDVYRQVEQATASARAIIWLCDFSPLPLVSDAGQPGWNEAELTRFATGKHIILTAAAGSQESWTSASLQSGIWRHHLLAALQGQVPETLDTAGRLTVGSLHRFLIQAVPRTLRKTFEDHRQQTPMCFPDLTQGHAASLSEWVLATFTPSCANPLEWLIPSRIKRILFRSETIGRVKDLSGFRKNHTVPERATQQARRFVQRIGITDLKADLERMHERIRAHFGYKRKEIDTMCEDTGDGTIHTPDFEYTVQLELDESNPAQVIWRREVGQWSSVHVIHQPAFREVFGEVVDRLVFEFHEPLDIAAYADRWEAEAPPGTEVHVDSETTQVEIALWGLTGRIHVTADGVTITGRLGVPTTLLEQFLGFLQKYLPDVDSPK